MRSIFSLFLPLLFVTDSALAGTVDGNSALALAVLVGKLSPTLSGPNKAVLTKLINGRTNFNFPAAKTIDVTAQSINCRASTVDIKAHACDLKFGGQTVHLSGRAAHELYATMLESGVASDGAAGSQFEALAHLNCVIDPNAIKQNAGGGAHCKYDPA
jgi:hypothetical protein